MSIQTPSTVPSSARIVRFHQTGEAEVLLLETLPLPEPAAGEVRLRVKAIGLNRAEVMFRRGQYLIQPQLPSLLGYEASGTIEAVGAGVDTSLIGKIVSTVPAFPADKYGVYGEVAIESSDLRHAGLLVWDKTYFGMGSCFRNQHELVLHFTKGQGWKPQRSDVANVIA